MSGLAGAWNLDGRSLDARELDAMSATLCHRGRDGESRRIDGAIGFSCQHLWVTPEDQGERQPVQSPAGAVLMIDGRLDNRDELAEALAVEPRASDARFALAAYDTWGDRFAERLNGDFAIAVFDSPRQRLILARDAIGVRPLYYYRSPALFAFASEIKALLAHPQIEARPDDEGVADFLLVGARPLDHLNLTCFQGITAVIPAHLVVATPRDSVARRYWDFDTTRQIRLRSPDEYAEGFRECFVRAVRRRARTAHPIAISVSGGLDSSSVFCQAETLRRAGLVPAPALAGLSYVSEREETDEQGFLGDIEAKFGVRIDRFPIEPLTGLVGGATEQVRAIEAPFVDYMWGVTRELHQRAHAAGARSMLSGHWGDQMLFSTAYLVDLLGRGAWGTVWRHTREYGRYFGGDETTMRRRRLITDALRYWLPPPLAPPLKWLRVRFLERRRPQSWFAPSFLATALRDRYRLATFERPFRSAHARAVYIEARSKYHVQCMEWNNKVGARYGLDVSFPFLDRDLIQYLMAIPGEVHARDGVPRWLLREALKGVLPESIRTRTWKSDFSSFVNMGLDQDSAAILGTLNRSCLAVRFGYLDPARMEPELAGLAERLRSSDNSTDSWDLGDTYGLEIWLRVFLESSEHTRSPQPLP